jgi:hypothetical protein
MAVSCGGNDSAASISKTTIRFAPPTIPKGTDESEFHLSAKTSSATYAVNRTRFFLERKTWPCYLLTHLIEGGSIRPTTSAKGKTGGTRWRKTKDPVRTAWLPARVVASNQGCLLIRQEMAFLVLMTPN